MEQTSEMFTDVHEAALDKCVEVPCVLGDQIQIAPYFKGCNWCAAKSGTEAEEWQ